jgi:hypothetical protein
MGPKKFLFPGEIETIDPEEVKKQHYQQIKQNKMQKVAENYTAETPESMKYRSQKNKLINLFSTKNENENYATKPLGNTFKCNVQVNKEFPKNYQMNLIKSETGRESFESRSISPQKRNNVQLEFEYEVSGESEFPSNEHVQNALYAKLESMVIENISIMENLEAEQESREPGRMLQSYKTMEAFKPSILTESESSYSIDIMSKRSESIVQVKGERGSNEQNMRRKMAHSKVSEDMNRILPLAEDMAQFLAVRKPPEEEYFLMTLMTYKLNHAHFAKICNINPQELFRKASKELKLQFFAYSGFIEKELDTVYMNLMYKTRKEKHLKKKPLTKLQKKQRHRVKKYPEEMYGKMLDDDYDFDDEYF